MWYPLVETAEPTELGKPVQDWGRSPAYGANTFVYADGHAASKTVKRENINSQYGYYPRVPSSVTFTMAFVGSSSNAPSH